VREDHPADSIFPLFASNRLLLLDGLQVARAGKKGGGDEEVFPFRSDILGDVSTKET